MVDKNEQPGSAAEPGENNQGTSVFDLFEPPPKKDPNSFGKIPVIKDGEIDLTDSSAEVKAAADAEAAGLQHWTAPPTGQVPAILSGERDEAGMWGDVKGPSWHGDDPSWNGPDLADVFADTDAVSIENNLIDLDDDDDEGDYRDEFDAPAVQRPARVVSSIRPKPDQDQDETLPPPARANTDERQVASPSAGQPSAQPQTQPQPQAQTQPQTQTQPQAQPQTPASQDSAPPVRRDVPAVTDHGHAPQGPPRPTPPPAQPAPTAPAPERPVLGDPARQAPPPVRAGTPKQARTSEPNIDDIRFADGQTFSADQPGSTDLATRRSTGHDDGYRPDVEDDYDPNYDPNYDPDYDPNYDPDYDPNYDPDLDEQNGFGQMGGRNLPKAISVGLGLVAIVLAAMYFGPYPTLLLVVVLALLAVLELYNAMRMAGLRPATLLGIVGTVAAPAAAYVRDDAAFPLIVALAVVFGTLWYLVGADTERPVLNLSLTMMGIFWVGGLAAFAALMIREDLGIQLLLATIIITVASDTLAYIGGRAYGSRPFHHASPNKTWEGTITGFVGSVFAGFAIGVTEMGSLWDGQLVPAIALGAVVGCLAPMGDLAESVVKRDLGVKDMGTLLPGHGGVLDRIDGLLFALPGAYYLALVYGLI